MAEPAKPRSAEEKTRVFISYSRKDMEFADKLEAALKARGFEVLIDRQEIYAFEDWWKRIESLIGRADTVVFVLSPDSVKSDVALKEVAYAASLNKRLAPIVCRRVEDAAVPEQLRRLNFIFFDDPGQIDARGDRLTEALQTDIGWIRRHTEFGDTAHRWTEAGRPSGMLLRPPVLDQAEAWLAFRPEGAPEPTAETQAFVWVSRKAEVAGRRWSRILNVALYTMLVGIIIGLIGWINQGYVVDQWRWWAITRPYASAHIWPYVLSAAKERALEPGASFKECAANCPEMIVVPAGSFMMGSPVNERGHGTIEEPQHRVVIARPFAVSKFELTFAAWDGCVTAGDCRGYKPDDQGWGRGSRPVIYVSWNDAQQYVAWFSKMTGKTYRLLSEAEYEYAARAVTTTIFPWGDDITVSGKAMANCDGCGSQWDNKETAPVGSFPPNKFGLYDMVGNVVEWTEDCVHLQNYNGAPADGSAWLQANGGDCNNRFVRGGSWRDSPEYLRCAERSRGGPVADRSYNIGFRVARTLDAR